MAQWTGPSSSQEAHSSRDSWEFNHDPREIETMKHEAANEKRNPKIVVRGVHAVYATISSAISSTYTVLVLGPLLPPKLNSTLANDAPADGGTVQVLELGLEALLAAMGQLARHGNDYVPVVVDDLVLCLTSKVAGFEATVEGGRRWGGRRVARERAGVAIDISSRQAAVCARGREPRTPETRKTTSDSSG